MAGPREKRDPYLWEALVSILALVTMISLAIVRYESDAHVPILIGVLVAALVGLRAGFSWKDIETGMLNGITNSLQAIVILGIIGILIGVWIMSGVVPTLLYYGLKILHPKIFLPATLIICSITSLATGTSWGTAGTIGIALIGIGSGLGFPLPIVAGAVLSGAYFGDKMSPLSDTTNLAPAMVGTDLYTHIKHMTYTTGVSIPSRWLLRLRWAFFMAAVRPTWRPSTRSWPASTPNLRSIPCCCCHRWSSWSWRFAKSRRSRNHHRHHRCRRFGHAFSK
jgi:NhaC family Na+:H+ antiporter